MATLMLSYGGTLLLTLVGSVEYLGLFVFASISYACFFYWFASRNKKIDVYIQPKIFNWKIKTALLLLGTIIILIPVTSFGIVAGNQIPFILILYLMFLLALVVCPGIFIPIFLLGGGLLFMNSSGLLGLLYWSYAVAIVMILLALFVSARHAVDTLILRIKEVGNFDTANHMENNSRIGIGSFLLCLIMPTALFARFIRRATKKTGLVKITLSLTPSGATPSGDERWIKKWTTVNLERMSESHQEVMTRVESMDKRFTKI